VADNFSLPATGITGASDDIGGVHYQRVKVGTGADGSYADVSTSAPMPVVEVWYASSAMTNVSASVTSVTVLAANANRSGAIIYNDSTANLRIAYSATASATSFTMLIPPQNAWVMTADAKWRGLITGIWEAANGAARVTEITP
jgi:hypothetical protein